MARLAGVASGAVLAMLIAGCSPSPPGPLLTEARGQEGEQLFMAHACGGCHTVQGVQGAIGTIGPDLTHIASRAGERIPGLGAREYIVQSILNPAAYKVPGYEGQFMPEIPLTDEELDAIVEFLMTRG